MELLLMQMPLITLYLLSDLLQDDEWHEEEEQVQDLEGLKVQALRLEWVLASKQKELFTCLSSDVIFDCSDDKPQTRSDAKESTNDDDENGEWRLF